MEKSAKRISRREFTDEEMRQISKLCGLRGVVKYQEVVEKKKKNDVRGRKITFKKDEVFLLIYDNGNIKLAFNDFYNGWIDCVFPVLPLIDYLRSLGYDFNYRKTWK